MKMEVLDSNDITNHYIEMIKNGQVNNILIKEETQTAFYYEERTIAFTSGDCYLVDKLNTTIKVIDEKIDNKDEQTLHKILKTYLLQKKPILWEINEMKANIVSNTTGEKNYLAFNFYDGSTIIIEGKSLIKSIEDLKIENKEYLRKRKGEF